MLSGEGRPDENPKAVTGKSLAVGVKRDEGVSGVWGAVVETEEVVEFELIPTLAADWISGTRFEPLTEVELAADVEFEEVGTGLLM